MFEYFKRKFTRLEGTIKIDTYPQYYEENGQLIKEEADGHRYIVKLDKDYHEIIIGEIK